MKTAARPSYRTLIIGVILLASGPLWGQHKQVIGYYPSWKWEDRNNLVNTAALPYGKFTVINFAFMYPQPDGRIKGVDALSAPDERILAGARDTVNGMRRQKYRT